MPSHRIAAALALAPLAFAASAAAGAPSCVPPSLQSLRASGAARIYSRGDQLFACLGSRRTPLGPLRGTVPFPARRIARYALSPRFAATDAVEMGVDTFASTVALIDLRTGRTLFSAPATTPERAAESFVTVAAIAVNATGVMAWIGERSAVDVRQPTYELHVHGGMFGGDGVVSSGTIPLSGLRVDRRRLSWQEGGANGRRVTVALSS